MQTLIVAFTVAFVIVLSVVRLRHWHLHVSADSQDGVQKFHRGAVPRIGGVGVAAGLALAVLFWRSEVLLLLSVGAFAVVYVAIYARLVRFRTPRWLQRRVGATAQRR